MISIEPTLMRRVEVAATSQTVEPEALIESAVRAYLRQLDRQRIKAEAQAFQAQHTSFIDRYLGEYVAIRTDLYSRYRHRHHSTSCYRSGWRRGRQ